MHQLDSPFRWEVDQPLALRWKEKLVSLAVMLLPSEEVHQASEFGDIHRTIVDRFHHTGPFVAGWWTDRDRFVDRYEAWLIGRKQLNKGDGLRADDLRGLTIMSTCYEEHTYYQKKYGALADGKCLESCDWWRAKDDYACEGGRL